LDRHVSSTTVEFKVPHHTVDQYFFPPHAYPGPRPDPADGFTHGYLKAGTDVLPLMVDGGEMFVQTATARVPIETLLTALGATPRSQRFGVVGFGSNLCPYQLQNKHGPDSVVVVLYGHIEHTDVVYNLISNSGYAYADLLFERGPQVSAGVTLLCETQLGQMIRSEQNYQLARLPRRFHFAWGDTVEAHNPALTFFAGYRPIWVPSDLGGPAAIAEIPARGRVLTPWTQRQTLDVAAEEFANVLRRLGFGALDGLELSAQVTCKQQLDLADDHPHKIKGQIQKEIQDSEAKLPATDQQPGLMLALSRWETLE
jgi:hypothetical protein